MEPFWKKLKESFYRWESESGFTGSSLKVLRDNK